MVQGGSWHALLFENPRVDYPLSLTWAFHFDFGTIRIDGESTASSLDIEWLPLDTPSWRSMADVQATSSKFADPAEVSVHAYMHHRFDAATVAITQQAGSRILAQVTVSGDIDRLGVPSITVEGWLDFTGIYVQPHERPATEQAATDLLIGHHIDVVGLTAHDRGHNYLLKPADPPHE